MPASHVGCSWTKERTKTHHAASLPGADGWQFFAERLHTPALAAVPVVVMTGVGIASDEWAKALSATDLLRKPIDVDRLLDEVNQYVTPPPCQERAAKPGNTG